MAETSLHDSLVKQYRVYLDTKGSRHKNLPNSGLLYTMFSNYRYSRRNKKHTGLRLSAKGNEFMQSEYTAYEYDREHFALQSRTLLTLDKNMKWPYYIDRHIIIFYSETDAALYTLYDGDLEML